MNLQKLAGKVCVKLVGCGLAVSLLTGCASLTSLALAPGSPAGAPEAPRSITTVKLAQSNFHTQKLDVEGRDQGFKLFELFTIVPASRVKAFRRMYQHAEVQPGSALTPANILVEQTEDSFILFSIPHVYVRADFVVFDDPLDCDPWDDQ